MCSLHPAILSVSINYMLNSPIYLPRHHIVCAIPQYKSLQKSVSAAQSFHSSCYCRHYNYHPPSNYHIIKQIGFKSVLKTFIKHSCQVEFFPPSYFHQMITIAPCYSHICCEITLSMQLFVEPSIAKLILIWPMVFHDNILNKSIANCFTT